MRFWMSLVTIFVALTYAWARVIRLFVRPSVCLSYTFIDSERFFFFCDQLSIPKVAGEHPERGLQTKRVGRLLTSKSCVKWALSFPQFFWTWLWRRLGLITTEYVDDLAKSCDCMCGIYIVLHADDILLLSSIVCEL